MTFSVMQAYQNERRLAPKAISLMDDCTSKTLDTSCSVLDASMSALEDDLLDMSFSAFIPDENCSSDQQTEDQEFMPTFNAIVARSQCEQANNISAIGIIEKEKEAVRKYSQRPSVLVQHFVEARIDTFNKNMDVVQYEAEQYLTATLGQSVTRRNTLATSKPEEGSRSDDNRRPSLASNPEAERQSRIIKRHSSVLSAGTLGSISESDNDEEEEEEVEEDLEVDGTRDAAAKTEAQERSKSISEFMEDRKNTFTRNVNFLKAAWAKKCQESSNE